MSNVETVINKVKEWAITFGAVEGENCELRRNVLENSFKEGGAYFGYVRPEEGNSGPFHDFSYTVFPDNENRSWVVCLGIGSLGFRNDYELASLPGLRRSYIRILNNNAYCKTSFLDTDSNISKEFIEKVPHLKKSLKMYEKVLPVCDIIEDPCSEEGEKTLKGFLALYADLRLWATNKGHRDSIKKAINAVIKGSKIDHENEVKKLIENRKYIVLQGPPGTGKTRLAKKIALDKKAKVFFTQFHAETAYSDFVYGIRPKLDSKQLSYEPHKGTLYNALYYAKNLTDSNEKVFLIIDEINRANLSNVLGPIFYLFEHKMEDSDIEIDLGGDFKISKIPDNFYVIATMNTADRSLAVVDFALRRRFAWYTLMPTEITDKKLPNIFFTEDFNDFTYIFERYATDEELNLQPGQGYFIAANKEEMDERIKYELMPLIKEYFSEGLILKARDAFSNYFHERIGEVLFK